MSSLFVPSLDRWLLQCIAISGNIHIHWDYKYGILISNYNIRAYIIRFVKYLGELHGDEYNISNSPVCAYGFSMSPHFVSQLFTSSVSWVRVINYYGICLLLATMRLAAWRTLTTRWLVKLKEEAYDSEANQMEICVRYIRDAAACGSYSKSCERLHFLT